MIQINEFKLSIELIMMIGEQLRIQRDWDESDGVYIDKVIEELRVSIGEEEPCNHCEKGV